MTGYIVLCSIAGFILGIVVNSLYKMLSKPSYGHYEMLVIYVDSEIRKVRDLHTTTVDDWTRHTDRIDSLQQLKKQLKKWGG